MYQEFLRALHPSGYHDFRAFGTTTTVFSSHVNSIQGMGDWIHKQIGLKNNVYVGVASRILLNGRKLTECGELHALFVDFDYKNQTEEEILRNLHDFPMPSIVVNSGGGLHCYWLLDTPLDLQQAPQAALAESVLQALAKHLGADTAAAHPYFILRLPGTMNFKYTPPRLVEMRFFDNLRRHRLSDIVSYLSVDSEVQKTRQKLPPIPHSFSIDERIAFAQKWLQLQLPAIAGHHGDNHTFQIVCSVVIGHDLPAQEAFLALQDWNERCVPPWTSHELRQKIRSAFKSGSGAIGEKLELHVADRPPWLPTEEEFEAQQIEDRAYKLVAREYGRRYGY